MRAPCPQGGVDGTTDGRRETALARMSCVCRQNSTSCASLTKARALWINYCNYIISLFRERRAPHETIRTVIDQRRERDPPERVENNIDRRVDGATRFHVALTNPKYADLFFPV